MAQPTSGGPAAASGVAGPAGRAAAADAVAGGLASGAAYASGRVILTRRGRLLADAVVRDLTP